jgi:hypothetical protein
MDITGIKLHAQENYNGTKCKIPLPVLCLGHAPSNLLLRWRRLALHLRRRSLRREGQRAILDPVQHALCVLRVSNKPSREAAADRNFRNVDHVLVRDEVPQDR